MDTITENIQRYLDGEGAFNGRPVLVVNNDFRVTTGQIYARLCRDDQYGFAIGKGLVKQGSDRQWRPLSFPEWEQAILGIFTLAKLQEQVGVAERRLLILDEPPKFFLVTCKQSRWTQYSDLFPLVDGQKEGAFVSRP
jgi:hypothetical protein